MVRGSQGFYPQQAWFPGVFNRFRVLTLLYSPVNGRHRHGSVRFRLLRVRSYSPVNSPLKQGRGVSIHRTRGLNPRKYSPGEFGYSPRRVNLGASPLVIGCVPEGRYS